MNCCFCVHLAFEYYFSFMKMVFVMCFMWFIVLLPIIILWFDHPYFTVKLYLFGWFTDWKSLFFSLLLTSTPGLVKCHHSHVKLPISVVWGLPLKELNYRAPKGWQIIGAYVIILFQPTTPCCWVGCKFGCFLLHYYYYYFENLIGESCLLKPKINK